MNAVEDYLARTADRQQRVPPSPTYRNGTFAVYPIEGELRVMRYGGDYRDPFRTTDAELAREVCDRLAA